MHVFLQLQPGIDYLGGGKVAPMCSTFLRPLIGNRVEGQIFQMYMYKLCTLQNRTIKLHNTFFFFFFWGGGGELSFEGGNPI